VTRDQIFAALGLDDVNPGAYAGGWIDPSGDEITSINPATGEPIAAVKQASLDDYERVVTSAEEVFLEWRMLPAPKRGEYVRLLANALRNYKEPLGALVALEMGKIHAEGEGEVQEMIDVADFAVGLSRQLYGLTIQSERPRHRMYEQWHPLGPIGVITSFNFPVAVWSWNTFISAVCGDTNVWKPSSQTPLTAVAVTNIAHEVMAGSGFEGVFNLAAGRGRIVGDTLINDRRLPLISATGSCDMGEKVGTAVAKRLGRSLLELGGNNAMIVMDDADLDLATRAALFAAVGTAGQRCTSLRRVIAQSGIVDEMGKRLVESYTQVRVGDVIDSWRVIGMEPELVGSGDLRPQKPGPAGRIIRVAGCLPDQPVFRVVIDREGDRLQDRRLVPGAEDLEFQSGSEVTRGGGFHQEAQILFKRDGWRFAPLQLCAEFLERFHQTPSFRLRRLFAPHFLGGFLKPVHIVGQARLTQDL